jgi:hypothetical protein
MLAGSRRINRVHCQYGTKNMRKLLLISAATALVGSISVAQAQNAPPSTDQPSSSERAPMMMRGMMGAEMPGREMGEHCCGGRMMMAHTNAAIFRIRRGDTSIFIKCADNESTQACVTAAGTLIDKLNQQPTTPPKP